MNLKRCCFKLGFIFLTLFLISGNWSCKRLSLKHHSEESANPNWELFGGQPQRINYREKTVSPPLYHIWTYKATSAINQSILVIDSVLYLATLDGRVDAVDIKTGKKRGRTKSEDGNEATCAFFEGNLVVAARYGSETLANYDLNKRKYLWKINAGDIATEPLIDDAAIYVSALYNHVDKYQLETGEKIWTFKTDGQVRSSPAINGNVLVVGDDNGVIYGLNAETGVLNWQVETGGAVVATPVIWGDQIFVGSNDSTFYAIDLNQGETTWRFNANRPIFQTAATNGAKVIFGGSDGQLFCLNFDNGEELWRFQAKSVISTSPVISGSVIYFGSLDRRYYCLNLENGKELWSFETKGRIRTSPVVWGDYVFGASEDKYLYAFSTSDSLIVE